MTSCSDFVNILGRDVPCFYSKQFGALKGKTINVPYYVENGSFFVLKDATSSDRIGVRFSNPESKELIVVKYGEYHKEAVKISSSFGKNRYNCDFILLDEKSKSRIVFNEMTSALNIDNLSKPVTGFAAGKKSKMQAQLLSSVETLTAVPQVKEEIEKYKVKECLMTVAMKNKYSVDDYINAAKTANRFSGVAMVETKGEGMELNCKELNNKGFKLKQYFQKEEGAYRL